MAIQRTKGYYNENEPSRYVDDIIDPDMEEYIVSEEDITLRDRVYDFSDLFGDMLLEQNECVTVTDNDGHTCSYQPEELHYFSYGWVRFSVRPLDSGCAGLFTDCNIALHSGDISKLKRAELAISPKHMRDDAVLLHEMIHLHETVIEDFPTTYHDIIFWQLYKSLSEKISDLDMRIQAFSHLSFQQDVEAFGGCHDILFLLKSYDLDIKMGYPLGTILAYPMPAFPIKSS